MIEHGVSCEAKKLGDIVVCLLGAIGSVRIRNLSHHRRAVPTREALTS